MKKKILFVYELENEELWKDGLWAALKLLKKYFEIEMWNLKSTYEPDADMITPYEDFDFILGWGSLNGEVDKIIRRIAGIKKGLCLGGYAAPQEPVSKKDYDVLFYETEWSRKWLTNFLDDNVPELVHAFGVNTQIYKTMSDIHYKFPWEYITVGAFALWKRQTKILEKPGTKLAIGQIQKNNLPESIDIIGNLLLGGCAVSDMIEPEKLAVLYNLSENCYIPADLMGGGERAVLEARACGVPVEVENDNPKLQELLTSSIWDEKYYAEALKKGIMQCLS